MSRWMVIGAVIVALALAALVFVPRAGTPGKAGPSGVTQANQTESLLTISPSAVESIQITWGDSTQHLVRGPLPDTWLREWTDASGIARRWPVSPTRVRGGVRLLHETMTAFDGQPLKPAEVAGTLTFKGNGQEESLSFALASLDGKRRATRRTTAGLHGCLISDQIVVLFDKSSVGEWLERNIFPGLTTPLSRIELVTDTQTVSMGRVAATWSLRAPVVTGVDPAKLNEVLLALETFTISKMTDTIQLPGTPATTTIRAELDRPTLEGDVVRRAAVRYTVETWPAANERVREVPARATVELVSIETGVAQPLWGPVQGVVSVESVSAATPSLKDLVGRLSLSIAASDVSAVTLSTAPSRGYSREGDRWSIAGIPVLGAELDNLKHFLSLLCDDRADAVSVIDTPPEPTTASCEVRVGEGNATRLWLQLVDGEGKTGTQVLFVQSGQIRRGYDLSKKPSLRAWLTGLLPV